MRKPPRQPAWDDHDAGQVRVLIECPPAGSPSIIAAAVERRGYAVRTCEGPSARPCALLEHGACALVDGADIVVNMLGATPREAAVVPALAALRRPPAIVAERPGPRRSAAEATAPPALPEPPAAVTEVRAPVTANALVQGIEEALRCREQRTAWWGDGAS